MPSFFLLIGSKTAGKCIICTRMFVDNHDISDMFEEHFVLKKKNSQLPISRLMETAKVKVGNFGKKFT